jgi:hypothetical protein
MREVPTPTSVRFVQARIEREQAELAKKQLADVQRETGKASSAAMVNTAPKSPPGPSHDDAIMEEWRHAQEEATAAKHLRHHTQCQPQQQEAAAPLQPPAHVDVSYFTPGPMSGQKGGVSPSDMNWQLQQVRTWPPFAQI